MEVDVVDVVVVVEVRLERSLVSRSRLQSSLTRSCWEIISARRGVLSPSRDHHDLEEELEQEEEERLEVTFR